MLLVLEDVHWIDPTTLELLGLAIERVAAPAGAAAGHLPARVQPPWPASRTSPRSRSPGSAGARARRWSSGWPAAKPLPAEVAGADRGQDRRRAAVRRGADQDGAGVRAAARTPATATSCGPAAAARDPRDPARSLMARLDRLAPVKEVAQIGAAIGREFSHALLAAVADRPERRAASRARPAGRGRAGLPPRHAARGDLQPSSTRWSRTRPTARLLKRRRQQLHARIAQVARGAVPRAAEAQPELLAHHCTEAGLDREGGRVLAAGRASGDRALGAGGGGRRISRRRWSCSRACPNARARRGRSSTCRSRWAAALIAAKGYAAPETGRAYARARELCELLGETGRRSPAAIRAMGCSHVRAPSHAAAPRSRAGAAPARAKKSGDDDAQAARPQRSSGSASLWRGRLRQPASTWSGRLCSTIPRDTGSLASLYA